MAKAEKNGADDREKKSEEMQRMYLELQMLDGKMKQIQQQMQMLATQAEELEGVMQSLDDFKGLTAGAETLVPLASGIFAKTTLADTKEVLVNVGSNVVTVKGVDEARAMLAAQQSEIRKVHEEFAGQLQNLAHKSEETATELQKFIQEPE